MQEPQYILGELKVEHPQCDDCAVPMWLTRLEPDKPDHDVLTFECKSCGYDCDRGRQTQVGRQIGGDSRSGWNFLIKIGCAVGALESVSIRIILFVCCNPNKPHQGAARRTDRSFYRPFWKRNRTERRHGRSRSLGCAGRMPTRDAALTLRRCCLLDAENVYGDTQAALR